MKNKKAIGRLDVNLFTVVYAKEKNHFYATLDYGTRSKGDKFVILTDDISKLSVSLLPTKENKKETVEEVVVEEVSTEVTL